MSEHKEHISIVPLNNFDSNVQSLKLDDGICLRRISNDELKKLRETFSGSRSMLMIALTNVNFVLEMNALVSIEGKSVILFDHTQPRVQNIILALRLLKPGDVTVSCGFLLDENREASGLAGPSFPIVSQNRYLLEQEDTDRLVELWKKLQTIQKDKPQLHFPLYQFNKAFEEKFGADKIVDYMVVLESIVFYKEKKSIEPAGKVIGIAIGMLLGNNQNERNKIKKTFEKAYEIRNAKVHGNVEKLKKYQKDIERLSVQVEGYLRCALRRLVEE